MDDRLDSDEEETAGENVGVEDVGYNRIYGSHFARPYGVENALLLRGLRGGYIVLDTDRDQIYKPEKGRRIRHDFVCETVSALWSLGDRGPALKVQKDKGRHKCHGYSHLRGHTCNHRFTKWDVLRLLLRHRLRLRVVLARSRVSLCILINDRFNCQ